MATNKVGFNSYVDIATSMAIQDSDREKLNHIMSKWSPSNRTEKDLETNPPDLLKLEWRKRIEEWQKKWPDGFPPIEDCRSLKELEFSAFFLQYPFVAMSLWNVMQTFYALDRLVCCTSKESLDKIEEWELMPPFDYLEASKVEKRWRSALPNLRKELENSNTGASPLPRVDDLISVVAKRENVLTDSRRSLKESKDGYKRDMLFWRMAGLSSSTVKLEDAQEELRRNLTENLRNFKFLDLMLKEISFAAKWRFSMIDTYLRLDDSHGGGKKVNDRIEDDQLRGMLSVDVVGEVLIFWRSGAEFRFHD
jgi:hypothetical protein